MEVSKVSIQNILGTRLDVSFHRNKFSFESKIFPLKELRDLVDINPPVNLAHLRKDDLISFIPMEVVDENNGVIIKALSKRVVESKGYTKFQNGDLLWAKITPCMQNGKSAIASNLQNGVGCGSTEFFVLRPKNHEVLIEYIHYLMRDQRFLDAAMNSFGGNAGQQRVAKSYIEKVNIPFPPLYIQQRIVDIYNKAKREKQEKEEESQRLLDEIDTYLLAQLGIELPKEQQKKLVCKVSISQLLGNKLDVRGNFNRKRNNSSLKYDEITLGSIASIKKGQTITRESAKSGDYPVIAGGQTSPYFHQSYNELEGAITISASGAYAGFVWYHDYKFFASDCIVIRSLDEDLVLTSFLYEILKLKQTEIYLMQRGAGQPHVYSNDIAKIMIPNVPIVLQNKIVSYVNGLRNQSEEFLREVSVIMDQARQKIEQVILN